MIESAKKAAPHSCLKAQDLEVRLGGRSVLRQAHLELEPGRLLAVIGPNGAGKTTLLRALAGVVPLAGGKVFLGQREVGGMPRREIARQLAYLPQETATSFSLEVGEVVLLGRYAYSHPFRGYSRGDREAVRQAMEQADVGHLAHRLLVTLSGGERRRVFLARAIAQQARVLVLDEPMSALDVGHAFAVLELLLRLADAGKAVIFSLHELTLAVRGPDEVILLHEGEITARGDPEQVLTGPAAQAAFGVPLAVTKKPRGVMPA